MKKSRAVYRRSSVSSYLVPAGQCGYHPMQFEFPFIQHLAFCILYSALTPLSTLQTPHSKNSTLNKKTWGAEAPHAPRFSRNASDCDLHEKAGGMPLPTVTAPSVRPPSKRGREVCKQAGKSNFPIKKCGSKRTRHAPSRKESYCSSS